MNDTELLKIEDLQTSFQTKRGVVRAVDGVSFSIAPGETLGIVGESGCGKSMTALSVMGLLEKNGKVTRGSIVFDGQNLLALSSRQRRSMCGDKLSMIFQEPMTSLNPVQTVGHQVRETLMVHGQVKTRDEAKARIIDLFRQVGIPDPERRYNSYPHQLSGGLRQRVMIAMAMACEPKLLIADEPTTALDVTIEAQILHLMRKLSREHNTAVMMITHNLGVVAEICDRVCVMYAGKIVEQAEVHELFRNPIHPYTNGLLRSLPKMQSGQERLYNIRGMVPDLGNMPAGCRFAPRCDHACARCREEEPQLIDVGNNHLVRCFCRGEEDRHG